MSKSTLGGFVCVRNGFHLDYSWPEAAASLLKVVDQLILCDSDSDDGTTQAMQRMAESDSRITYVNWPWPNPKAESHHWFIKWLRFAQSHLTTDYCLYLDADEVLSDAPDCHAAIRDAVGNNRCLAVDRLNFWRDAYSLVPEGECCGKWCVRFGPIEYPVVSDEPHARGECWIVDEAVQEPRVQIFHLGFLRRRDAFYRKSRAVLNAWFGAPDSRLVRGEQEGKELWETECSYSDRLVPFSGYMPDAVQRWLSARGHSVPDYLAALPGVIEAPLEVVAPVRSEPISVRIAGDFGDVIVAMALFKPLGRVRIYACDRNICKPLLSRLHMLKPLLESQPYVESVEVHNGEDIHYDESSFRGHHRWTQSLHHSHLLHYRSQPHLPPISPDFRKPWLEGIAPDPRTSGRVLVHRTNRYNNDLFPWKTIFDFYGKRILIVGTDAERGGLTAYAGEAEYVPTADLLEVARLVAGADLIIAGQSCVLAIAEAMKRPRIAEMSLSQPDVIVARSPEAQYVGDGCVKLPDVTGSGTTTLSGSSVRFADINLSVVPPGYWQLPGFVPGGHFNSFVQQVASTRGISGEEAKNLVVEHNVQRCPKFFNPRANTPENHLFETALANALR